MSRPWYGLALLALAVASCTSTDAPGTTEAPTTTTGSHPVSTNTTTVGVDESRPDPELPDPVDVDESSPDPELPDPVDVAEQGWGEIAGYNSAQLGEDDLDGVDFRLGPFAGVAIEGISYSGLEPEDGGETVIGLAMAPALTLQGDPFLAPGLAGAIAGPFDEVEEIEVADVNVVRIFVGEVWWYFWASNTHLYATIGSEGGAENALASTIAGAPEPYLWQAGDCLWFGTGEDTQMPYAPYGDAYLVACSDPHTHEVIHSSSGDYGPGDEHPGEALSQEVGRSCGQAFRDYTGTDWADSKISAIRYLPDPNEWAEGDRYSACVAERSDQNGGATRIDGTLEGLGPDSLISRSIGDCHAGTLNTDPVDCQLTHTAQFIGFLEDPTEPDTSYPSFSEIFERESEACDELIEEFAPISERNGARISARIVPPSVVEWEDNVRTFRCFAIAIDNDGEPVEISGSFAGDWEIVRFSEDDITA